MDTFLLLLSSKAGHDVNVPCVIELGAGVQAADSWIYTARDSQHGQSFHFYILRVKDML